MAWWNSGLLPIYDIKLLLNSFYIQLIWQNHTNASVKDKPVRMDTTPTTTLLL